MNKTTEKVADLIYLSTTMGGNKRLVKEIIDVFLKQAPEEISSLKGGINSRNHSMIKNSAHAMRSSASIMGISSAVSLLQQIKELAQSGEPIDDIREISDKVTKIIEQAVVEITAARAEYV